MKVFHLEANGGTNTAEYVRKITESVESASDFKCKVFTSKKHSYSKDSAIPVFLEYATSGKLSKLIYYIFGYRKIYKYLKDLNEPAIFHAHWLRFSPVDHYFIKKLSGIAGLMIGMTVHNILPHEPMSFDQRYFDKIYQYLDFQTFHYNSIKQAYEKKFKLAKTWEIIKHYGYDKPDCNVAVIPNSILFIGNIRDYKGVDLLLEAMGPLKHLVKKVTVAGKLEIPESSLTTVIGKHELDSIVNLKTDWLTEEEMHNLFCSHELVVLPYRSIDNSGMVHLVMSYGKPLITTKVGSIPEIISHMENGYLCEPNDQQSLEETIRLALANKELTNRMGIQAKELMQGPYSLDEVGKHHISFYKSLINS